MSYLRIPSIFLSAVVCAALTGCGVTTGTPSIAVPLSAISGKVHGGQQPISGAQVYLYAAGTSGYGSMPTSLLGSPGYVTTDADGNFSFNGSYSLSTCQSAHDLVYLVSVGGNPGAGSNNPNAVLMAALGDCANLSASTFTYVSEVTTVASVYALQQFMSPGTYNVGTSSTNLTGLENAFLTVPNLVSLSTGAALAATPAGNGAVPQQELNTLANVLAACINSASPFATCSSLYTAAKPTNGTAPTDTLGTILDIALNPAQNVAALYTLPPPAVPFMPALTAQPNDWTVSVNYTGGGLYNPGSLAIDGVGNIWTNNAFGNSLSEFNTVGVSQYGSSGLTANVPVHPYSVAITPAGNVWVNTSIPVTPTSSSYPIVELTSAGGLASSFSWPCGPSQLVSDKSSNVDVAYSYCTITSSGTVSTYAQSNTPTYALGSLAIDESGNYWAPTQYFCGNYCGTLLELSSLGAYYSGESLTGWPDGIITNAYGVAGSVAVDAQGDAWTTVAAQATGYPGSLVEISPSGAILSPAPGPSSTGYTLPNAGSSTLVIDGANSIWTSNLIGTVSHISNTGTTLSTANGYADPGVSGSGSMAIDSAGNLWVDPGDVLVEWVGVAAPVTTPLAQNLVNNSIGQRP